ncbi:MAG: hypothetical protein EOO00_08125 [Chitinophagaceae bacterium]|nr:MAG: hypothetical protein EOO00_08125 [Chitinophagaceae bacterium]
MSAGYEFGGVACNPRPVDQQFMTRSNLIGSNIDHPLVDVSCLHPGIALENINKQILKPLVNKNAGL